METPSDSASQPPENSTATTSGHNPLSPRAADGRVTPQQDQLQRQFHQQVALRPCTPPNLQVLPPETEGTQRAEGIEPGRQAVPPPRPSRSGYRRDIPGHFAYGTSNSATSSGASGYSAVVIPIGGENGCAIRGSITKKPGMVKIGGLSQRKLEYGSGNSGTKATVRSVFKPF